MKLKSLLIALLALTLVFSFALVAASCDEEPVSQGSGVAEKETVNANKIGDYEIEIKSCRLAKSSFGKEKVVIVKYAFTNNSDDAIAFSTALKDTVYQNDVELDVTYFVDDGEKFKSNQEMKDVRPGKTFEFEIAYELDDEESDIEVEVKELFGFDDTVITKTFSIK